MALPLVGRLARVAPTAIASHQDDTGDQQEGQSKHNQLKDRRLLRQVGLLQERLVCEEE